MMKIKNLNILIVLLVAIVTTTSCAKNTVKTTETNSVAETTVKPVQKKNPIKRVNATEFKTETEGKEVQLVDVRTPNEFNEGHIENAENVNVFDKNFMEQMAKYKKDTPVYVYCRSGGRSMKAAKKLKAEGYNVVNLDGGFMGWSAKGFKAVK